MEDMIQASGVPVFIPIRAESKIHFLRAHSPMGSHWCSYQNNQTANNFSKVHILNEYFFQDWIMSYFEWKLTLTLTAVIALLLFWGFKWRTNEASANSSLLWPLLTSPHQTPPRDMQVIIIKKKYLTTPKFLYILIHSWIHYCNIHQWGPSSLDFCLLLCLHLPSLTSHVLCYHHMECLGLSSVWTFE